MNESEQNKMRHWISDPEFSCELLKAVMDAMADAVYVVDMNGVVRVWNRGAEILTGYSADEAAGRPCKFLEGRGCPDCDPANGGCPVLAGEEVNARECSVTGKDGSEIPVIKNVRPLHAADGRIAGVVETLTDLRPMKAALARIEVLEDRVFKGSRFRKLVGKNSLMQEVFRLVMLAADSEASVIVTGESGTGKELVAEAIHEAGRRAKRELVKVNCSALPESLLESELFGYAKGAFTGALVDKPGRFELAEGGTVFLDEIGDVSPPIQMKLLRVLQEKTFERVGENRRRNADVRIITATNRDLRALVLSGKFREDLFYRINVFPIHVPPLRERRSDIPLLVGHFLEKYSAETGKRIGGVSADAMRRLMDFAWPGNVRQLENAIEHGFVTSAGGELTLEDLPPEVRTDAAACEAQPAGGEDRASILEALEKARWNRTRAAKLLGLSRVTLWKRMKDFGIQAKEE